MAKRTYRRGIRKYAHPQGSHFPWVVGGVAVAAVAGGIYLYVKQQAANHTLAVAPGIGTAPTILSVAGSFPLTLAFPTGATNQAITIDGHGVSNPITAPSLGQHVIVATWTDANGQPQVETFNATVNA